MKDENGADADDAVHVKSAAVVAKSKMMSRQWL